MKETILTNAIEGKFSAFSNDVKLELKSKLSNLPEIQAYNSEIGRIHELKDAYQKINSLSAESAGSADFSEDE